MNNLDKIQINNQLKVDNFHKIGYEQNSEYIEAITDSEGKVIEGIKNDGCKHFVTDVIINNSAFIKDVETKTINISENCITNTDNSEWLQVTIDNNGKIIEGIKKDGSKYIGNLITEKRNSKLFGKKIAYNGDSYCESRYGGPSDNGGSYPQLIAEKTGCIYENRAIGGARLTNVKDGGWLHIVDDIPNMTSDADIICFEGGVNDYAAGRSLGTVVISDYTSEYDETTISGALESIFRQSINKWIGKPIVFIICHKFGSFWVPTNSGSFIEIHDRMIEICRKQSIPYFDAFECSGLNGNIDVQNISFFANDRSHPNKAGYENYYVPQLITLFESLI